MYSKMKTKLAGKVAIITGAGRGIGLAIAKALAAKGVKVAIGDIDLALAQQAATELGGFAGYLDVRDRATFAAFFTATKHALGHVDILVNNAGIMPAGAFEKEDAVLADTQIDINLRGVIHGTRLAVQHMLPRGHGHIVNVASMAGRLAIPGLAVYCATKFGVVGLTEALAEEYRDSGLRFSMILPSKVTTELAAGTDDIGARIPAVPPEAVADAVLLALTQGHFEVPVPDYLAAVNGLQGLAPHWLLRAIRRVFGDDVILTRGFDEGARAGYNRRLASLTTLASSAGQPAANQPTPANRAPVTKTTKATAAAKTTSSAPQAKSNPRSGTASKTKPKAKPKAESKASRTTRTQAKAKNGKPSKTHMQAAAKTRSATRPTAKSATPTPARRKPLTTRSKRRG